MRKTVAVLLFILVLIFWFVTVRENALGFVSPSGPQEVGFDLWTASMWGLMIYATRRLIGVFRDRRSVDGNTGMQLEGGRRAFWVEGNEGTPLPHTGSNSIGDIHAEDAQPMSRPRQSESERKPKNRQLNLKEGTRRLAILVGALGAVVGGFPSYSQLDDLVRQQARHSRFERANQSSAVQDLIKHTGSGITIPLAAIQPPFISVVNRDGIASVKWKGGNEIAVESIQMQDGEELYDEAAPNPWLYLLVILYPVIGFAAPWITVRGLAWTISGFTEARNPEFPR